MRFAKAFLLAMNMILTSLNSPFSNSRHRYTKTSFVRSYVHKGKLTLNSRPACSHIWATGWNWVIFFPICSRAYRNWFWSYSLEMPRPPQIFLTKNEAGRLEVMLILAERCLTVHGDTIPWKPKNYVPNNKPPQPSKKTPKPSAPGKAQTNPNILFILLYIGTPHGWFQKETYSIPYCMPISSEKPETRARRKE